MICLQCNHKVICNVYDMVSLHTNAITININNCIHYSNSNSSELNKVVNNIEEVSKSHTYDFSESFDQKEYEKMISTVEDASSDKIIMTCKSCNGADYAEYIGICYKCQKETCGNCSTNDKGINYCNECWEGM